MRFKLEGLTPLLMHADSIDGSTAVKAWQVDPANKNLSTPGDDRSPAWTWSTYLYNDGAEVAMPSQNIMVCLRQAGAQVILKKQKTFKELSQSGLFIPTEFCKFTVRGIAISMADVARMRDDVFANQCSKCEKLGFRLWAKRAAIGKNKHVRVRPRFDTWTVEGEIEVLAPEITREILEQLFTIAGRIGLGDWRPGCKTPGSFGMFQAKVLK